MKQYLQGITYEVLCIDDCSTDKSLEICTKFAMDNPNIRVMRNKKNSGVSYTRNRLIENAKGKYIWFIDPDDMLYPDIARIFYLKIEENDCDVILGDYLSITEREMNIPENIEKELHWRRISKTERWLPVNQNGIKMCAIWAGLFKRDFLLLNDLHFNEKMIAQEDTLFYYEFILRTDKIIKCSSPSYFYRQKASSVMHSRSKQRLYQYYLSMVEMFKVYKKHLDENDFDNKEILEEKIGHSRQNIITCLVSVDDTKMVKDKLKNLKEIGIYPYPFRKAVWYTKESLLRKIIYFFQPIEPFFWLLHLLYKISYRSP